MIKMSSVAYVMMSVETGTDERVLNELMKIEGIKEACLVYGIYDVVGKIEVESMDKLREIIQAIRQLRVRTTQTLIAYKVAQT